MPALSGVDFDIRPGEVHGLLGANGCGKSTLIKVLAGFHQADAGQILVSGTEVSLPLGPRGLRDHGMAFVHQDLGLVPNSTVLEHMALDTYGRFGGLATVSLAQGARPRRGAPARFEVNVDLDATVDTLSPVQRAMVAIVRAVGGQQAADSGSERAGRVLVLDEPTVFLPRDEVEILFALLRRLKEQGDAVLLVSHDLDEVLAGTDRLTVLRDGRLVGTRETEASDTPRRRRDDPRRARRARGTTGDGGPRRPAAAAVRRDPITGDRHQETCPSRPASPVRSSASRDWPGSGFEELPELLFGARKLHAGSIAVGGVTRQAPLSRSELDGPRTSCLIPSDRKKEGAAQELTVTENLARPLPQGPTQAVGVCAGHNCAQQALTICTRLNVKPLNPSLNFGNLSGGNQQKALLGKWLQTNPSIMLLNEPTQGVDVGARKEIFRLIRSAVTDGMAVLCCTSDYEQLVEMADRVVVLHDGRVHKQLYGADITKAQLAASIYSEEAVS